MIKKIKLLRNKEEIIKLNEFISSYPLNYPDYDLWTEKCIGELLTGYKKTFYAPDMQRIVGCVIFQRHKEDSSILEIKNFRVEVEYQNQGIGGSLDLMINRYAQENGFLRVQIDTHSTNEQMKRILLKRGYNKIAEEMLYTRSQKETIYARDL